MAEMIDFGGWRKRRGQDIYEPKEGHPYLVEEMRSEQGSVLGYVGKLIGDNPAILATIDDDRPSKEQFYVAKQRCEQHWREQQSDEPAAVKLSVARVPLDWQQQTDDDVEGEPAKIWVATRPDGTAYAVEEDVRDWRADPPDTSPAWFCQADGEELGEPQPSLEAGQALCQWHADTELAWEAIGPCYVSLPYHCDPAPDGGWGAWFGDELIDDTVDSSEEAQEACQDHYREQHPPPQAEPAEATPEPAATPAVPKRERGRWTIPMPLTDAEKARAKDEYDEIWGKIRQHQRDIAASAERHAALKKRKTEQIGDLEDQLDELRERMPEREIDCYREYSKDPDGVWWVHYISPDDEAFPLHERRLEQWEQRQLFGEGDPPPDKPPPPATEPPPPPDDEPVNDPRPATEFHPEADHAPPAISTEPLPPAGEPLQWSSCKGEHGTEYYCGGEREGYTISRDPGTQTKPGKGGLLRIRYLNLALGIEREWGNCVTVAEAKKEAKRDNDIRVRWSGAADSPLLVSHCGCYQAVDIGEGQRQLEYVGPGIDSAAEVLGEPHDGLAAALLAAQADADQRRAEA